VSTNYGTSYSFSGGGNDFNQTRDVKIHSGKDRGDTKAYKTIFRIAPPMLSGIESGRIVIYEPKHWGYSGVNRKDPTKSSARTFICTRERDFRENVITQECAECLLIEEEEKRLLGEICSLLGIKDDGKLRYRDLFSRAIEKATNTTQRDMMLSSYRFLAGNDGIGAHSLDTKPWKLIAWSETDQMAGFLRLSAYNWRQLKARKSDEKDPAKQGLIDKWSAMGVDPIAPDQGLFFELTRIGNGSGIGTAKDKIEVVQEYVDPNRPIAGSKPRMAPITPTMDAAFAQCGDLTDCSPSVRLSPSQVKQLTDLYRLGQNSPEAVDEIFNAGRQSARPVERNFRSEQPQQQRDEMPSFAPPPAPAPVAPAPIVVPPSPPRPPAASAPLPPIAPPAQLSLSKEEEDLIKRMRGGGR